MIRASISVLQVLKTDVTQFLYKIVGKNKARAINTIKNCYNLLQFYLKIVALMALLVFPHSGAISMTVYEENVASSISRIADERLRNNKTEVDCSRYFDYIEIGTPVGNYDDALRGMEATRGLIRMNHKNQLYYTISNTKLRHISSNFKNKDYLSIVFIIEHLLLGANIISYKCTLLNSDHP